MRTSPVTGWADLFAIGTSAACLVHCLLLPILIAMAPALSAFLDLPESLHLVAFIMAVPVSMWAMVRGYRLHRKERPVIIALLGLVALGLGSLAGFPFRIESGCTIIGSVLLASAHLRNWRLKRSFMRAALA